MYSLRNYGDMILDSGRTRPFVEALRQAVKPGCVVLDIGTGTGLFALLACRFGARRVFAIEPGDAIEVAREIAAANGLTARIEFFEALSTDVDLPERADVIVAEIHGILPLYQRSIVTLVDARRRFLAPGGTMIPMQETLWASPVEAPDEYRTTVSPWMDSSLGIDMSVARALLTNDLCRAQFDAGQLMAQPVCCATLDYASIEDPNVESRFTCAITREGTVHGLAMWFDSTLMRGIELTNAPGKPRLIFGNAFFPWTEPVAVSRGDQVHVTLRANLMEERYLWSWDTRVEASAGATKASFRQSQFLGAPLSASKLSRQSATHVPRLGEEGEIEWLILQRMSESRALGEIAKEVSAKFPRRYPQWKAALGRVGELSVRFGD